jgi:hypothetical protein
MPVAVALMYITVTLHKTPVELTGLKLLKIVVLDARPFISCGAHLRPLQSRFPLFRGIILFRTDCGSRDVELAVPWAIESIGVADLIERFHAGFADRTDSRCVSHDALSSREEYV